MRSCRMIVGLLGLLFFAACQKKDETPVEYAERTVIVYLAVDNNFKAEAKQKIDSLQKYWKKSYRGNLLVFSDAGAGNTKLIRILSKNGNNLAQVVEDYNDCNSADPEVLKKILIKIKNDYPADSYGMVVLSHASGWLPGNALVSPRSVMNDKGREMEFPDFVEALPMNMDFVIFDACFMGMVEVAYEMKDKVKYVVASPAEVLAPGFVYTRMMEHVMQKEPDLEAVAQDFYEYYARQEGAFRTATVAVVNTAALEDLATVTASILKETKDKVVNLEQVQQFGYGQHMLFFDLADYIQSLSPSNYKAFEDALGNCIVYKAHTPGYYSAGNFKYNPIASFGGLGVYIPQEAYPWLNEKYNELSWTKRVR